MHYLVNKQPPWGDGPLKWMWEVEKLILRILATTLAAALLVFLRGVA